MDITESENIIYILNICIPFQTVTPTDYEPPGFKASPSDNFTYEDEPMNIRVGDVTTVSTQQSNYLGILYTQGIQTGGRNCL